MMAVATLVMHPGLAVALIFPFSRIGAASTLVILGTHQKFRRRILGQIVGQSLPVQAHPEAACHNDEAVLCNGLKVFPGLHYPSPDQPNDTHIIRPLARFFKGYFTKRDLLFNGCYCMI